MVTGASAGVGRAVARRFARDGTRIALIARGLDGLEAARREIEEAGSTALVCPVDVANAALFLASDEARGITGVGLPVDLGALLK